MSKKTVNKAELMDYILTSHKIECESCSKVDYILNCDEFDALDCFYEQGWRVKDNKCLCKKCQKL